MTFISKRTEPALLTQWRLENKKAPQNLSYDNMPKAEVRDSLLAEQGNICGYSMWRISSPNKGHIEHIRSQKLARERRKEGGTDFSDIDYANMVYCYPGKEEKKYEFGARKKDSAPVSHDTFISPLDPKCQGRFRFEKDGKVGPDQKDDVPATATIALLGLNADRLTKARAAAIRSLPIFQGKRLVSANEAKKRARLALERDSDGTFPEFAVALHQVLSRYADKRAAKEAGFAKASRD